MPEHRLVSLLDHLQLPKHRGSVDKACSLDCSSGLLLCDPTTDPRRISAT
jgi:hypothetical protein